MNSGKTAAPPVVIPAHAGILESFNKRRYIDMSAAEKAARLQKSGA